MWDVLKGLRKETRGISPLIATLILIMATIVGGGIVYSVMRGQAETLATGADFQIVDADIIAAGGAQMVTVTVRNTGTMKLTAAASVTTETTPVAISIGDVEPGQSQAGENTTGTWVAGTRYIMKVTATAVDGSTLSKILTVTARG